jgi:hypothetical protein
MESAQPEIQYKRIPGRPWGHPSFHANASTPKELEQERETSTNGEPNDMSVKSKPARARTQEARPRGGEQETRQFVIRETTQRECPPPFLCPQIKSIAGAPMDAGPKRILWCAILAGPKRSELKDGERPRCKLKSPATQSARPSRCG